MDWIEASEILGNIGEFVGSIAVLATLIYLALQVKQSKTLLERNEKITLSQVHQARADTRVNYLLTAAEISTASIDSLYDNPKRLDDLTPEELSTARNLMRASVAVQDNVLFQHELGLLDEQTLPATNAVISAYYEVWEAMGIPLTDRMRSYYKSLEATK
jgi:hypothetical protein